MNRQIAWLKKPFPRSITLKSELRDAFFYGSFVFLFLLLFQPFGLSGDNSNKALKLAGYGLVTFLTFPMFDLIGQWIFPEYFREEKWTVGKQLTAVMVTLGITAIANAGYSIAIGFAGAHPMTFVIFLLYTLAVGIFPASASVLFIQIRSLKRNTRTSQEVNEELALPHSQKAKLPPPPPLQFTDDEGTPQLELPQQAILYIQAAGNYVEVHHLVEDQTRKLLIRSSLKNMARQLEAQPHLARCHRSFIVNLDRVTRTDGNSAGLLLFLDVEPHSVPVSRSYIPPIKQQLEL